MSGSKSRSKGQRGEREVAKLLEAATGVRWIRTDGGRRQAHGDVAPKGPIDSWWNHAFVEVKSHGEVTVAHLLLPTDKVLGWWRKAFAEAEAGEKAPVLFVRIARWGLVVVVEDAELAGMDPGNPVAWSAQADWDGHAVWALPAVEALETRR